MMFSKPILPRAQCNGHIKFWLFAEKIIMGRVRTKTVKKAARVIIEKYYTKLTLDFDTNKRIIEEVAVIPSKPLRNKVYKSNLNFFTAMMTNILTPTPMIKWLQKERPTDSNFECICVVEYYYILYLTIKS